MRAAAPRLSCGAVSIWMIVVLGAAIPLMTDSHPEAAQSPGAPAGPDVTTLGPQVGDTVPDFRLPDQHGRTRTLSSLMGPKGLMLVFNRSADW